jgi:hypothetical protein
MKDRRRSFLSILSTGGNAMNAFLRCAVLFFLLTGLEGCGSTEQIPDPPYASENRRVTGTPAVGFISDTQSPLWFEAIPLKADDNEEATQILLGTIARDTSMTAVFHLGDMVALGSFRSYWEQFDANTFSLRVSGIPIFPVFGNHEYMPFAADGRMEVLLRFPQLDSSRYMRRVGEMAVLLLNSNYSQLGDSGTARQKQWYLQELERLDADSTVALTVVSLHHSPFTNSKVVNPSEEVQRDIVPGFLQSEKGRLFISGHAHAFEHFRREGKDFLVIGGGGGLLQPLRRGAEEKYPDLYPQKSERSFFHYLRCAVRGDSLVAQMLRLSDDRAGLDTAYTISIPLLRAR